MHLDRSRLRHRDRKLLVDLVLACGIADTVLLAVLIFFAFVDRTKPVVAVVGVTHGLNFLTLVALTSYGAHALLSEVLLDCGDLPGAVEAFAPAAPPAELPDYVGWNYVLHARGAIRAAQLDFGGALEDFLACGARQERWQAPNPSVIPWRSQAALACLALENRDDALPLAIEELRLARRFGAPRAIGIALRAVGLINADWRQVALLREAASVLESSPAKLEHARALTDLGAALRRSNQRAAARTPLRDAITLATRCGALPIATRANNELIATGARPRKAILTGLDALTPIERQAAMMAADGMSNPQIAQALFISRKTVEKRLSEAYRKLDIRSRDQLGSALAAPTAAPPTQPADRRTPK